MMEGLPAPALDTEPQKYLQIAKYRGRRDSLECDQMTT